VAVKGDTGRVEVATATSDGVPSARLVVLRGLQGGLAFFTDCDSGKGAELAANPRAAAGLHWLAPVHRQVRVTGPAERVSEDEADQCWSARAPAVRLTFASTALANAVPISEVSRWLGHKSITTTADLAAGQGP
jgi:pyridoxamine 5'-phosphate oxidase